MRERLFGFGKQLLKGCGVVLLLLVVLVGLRSLAAATSAEAASDTYHPSYCLGGWKTPKFASGLPYEDGAGTLTGDNSAILQTDTAAQLFCGYFGVEAAPEAPTRARVHFNWKFLFPEAAPSSAWEKFTIPETPAIPETETLLGAEELPVEAPAASAEEKQADPPASEPVGPVEAPAEAPAPAAASEPSARVAEQVLAFLFGRAHLVQAEEPLMGDELLEVSYSFDGTHWRSAGRVGRSNWQDFSIELPAASWEELQSLQVMVVSLPTLNLRPPIYLESIRLDIETERSFIEAVQDSAQAAGEAVGEVLATVDEVANSLVGLVLGAQEESARPQEEILAQKKAGLRFTVAGAAVDGSENLPPPAVAVEQEGSLLRISGSCTQAYFVVLTYRKPEDYKRSPRSFASNYAGPCDGGAFSYEVTHLPENTPAGTYYLLLAQQGEDGPWEPISSLLPITIDTTR